MRIDSKRIGFYVLFLCVVSVLGCDQVQKFTQRISPKKEKQGQLQIQQQAATGPVSNSAVQQPQSMENVVVRVGNWALTKTDYDKRVAALQEMIPDFDPQNKQQVRFIIEELLQQQLFVQDALRRGLDKDEDMEIAVQEFRNSLLAQKLAADLLKDLAVSEEEIKAAYEQYKENFTVPFQWKVREIVVKNEAEAQDIVVQLNQGSAFEDLAQKRSISSSASKGGDLGIMMVENFEFEKMAQTVFILEPGQVSNYFKGPLGYYIVKVESRTGGESQSYDDVKAMIEQELLMQKQQNAVLEHLDKLRSEIPNQINEQLLGLSPEVNTQK
ncbi:MAG TPA: peptidyl-prolyl cis-trans isomerase [Candidatus Omnitrophota bacterium]|nr:peptidyl-prolyl cis-trans isomerase [Candidatus Omnitrophota bacterium]HSA30202.1 peptidyl-prolyl cis-trans isomerase [Candidatus Omnitrophota bacterium]